MSQGYERGRRVARTAGSWVKRAIAVLRVEGEREPAESRWLVGYEAEQLLTVLLWDGESLVALLNDDADFDRLRRHAREMADSIRRRELVPKLSDVAGRTPEEAAAFERKADELRSRT